MKTTIKNILKMTSTTALILIPSIALASTASIESVRNALSPAEAAYLIHEETKDKNKFESCGLVNLLPKADVTIGSVRKNLPETETGNLYREENEEQRPMPGFKKKDCTVTIGSVRANLSSEELTRLYNEERKGR